MEATTSKKEKHRKDEAEMNISETGSDDVKWIKLIYDRFQRWLLVLGCPLSSMCLNVYTDDMK
jgi:hypothetical protein